jgi:hypothetical protein
MSSLRVNLSVFKVMLSGVSAEISRQMLVFNSDYGNYVKKNIFKNVNRYWNNECCLIKESPSIEYIYYKWDSRLFSQVMYLKY